MRPNIKSSAVDFCDLVGAAGTLVKSRSIRRRFVPVLYHSGADVFLGVVLWFRVVHPVLNSISYLIEYLGFFFPLTRCILRSSHVRLDVLFMLYCTIGCIILSSFVTLHRFFLNMFDFNIMYFYN